MAVRTTLGRDTEHPVVLDAELLSHECDLLTEAVHLRLKPHPLVDAVGGDAPGEGEGEVGREIAWTVEERMRAGQPFGRRRFRRTAESSMGALPGGYRGACRRRIIARR